MEEKKTMNGKKQHYVSPKLNTVFIEMENGIAAGSAQVSPGDQSNPNSPDVNSWNNNGDVGGGTNSFDF